jgi:hypothetical protein
MKARRNRTGPRSGGPPEGSSWIWLTNELVAARTWAALSITARRILDTLICEYLAHGGRENGYLAVTYRQLETLGVTKADIPKGLLELQICGFVRVTHRGLRVAGGGEPSRYALTWLPTMRGTPQEASATDDWRDVLVRLNRKGIVSVRGVRGWLRAEVRCAVPARTKATLTRDIEGAPQLKGEARLHMRGEKLGSNRSAAPQLMADESCK